MYCIIILKAKLMELWRPGTDPIQREKSAVL